MNENGSEEGVAAAEIEETAPAAPRGPKQTPAPTEQSGATAANPPVPTTTTARGAAEPREISHPAGGMVKKPMETLPAELPRPRDEAATVT